jgi:hypothetical protein
MAAATRIARRAVIESRDEEPMSEKRHVQNYPANLAISMGSDLKDRIERAARASGQTLNAFSRQVLLAAVVEIERQQRDKAMWLCRCECGTEKRVQGVALRRGLSRSCGCLAAEVTSARRRKKPITAAATNGARLPTQAKSV